MAKKAKSKDAVTRAEYEHLMRRIDRSKVRQERVRRAVDYFKYFIVFNAGGFTWLCFAAVLYSLMMI